MATAMVIATGGGKEKGNVDNINVDISHHKKKKKKKKFKIDMVGR